MSSPTEDYFKKTIAWADAESSTVYSDHDKLYFLGCRLYDAVDTTWMRTAGHELVGEGLQLSEDAEKALYNLQQHFHSQWRRTEIKNSALAQLGQMHNEMLGGDKPEQVVSYCISQNWEHPGLDAGIQTHKEFEDGYVSGFVPEESKHMLCVLQTPAWVYDVYNALMGSEQWVRHYSVNYEIYLGESAPALSTHEARMARILWEAEREAGEEKWSECARAAARIHLGQSA